jgi:hypothetical protein
MPEATSSLYSSVLYWEQWTMGDAGAFSTSHRLSKFKGTGLAARSGLGDRGGGESA